MSSPSAANLASPSAPPPVGVSGKVCPHCQRRFADGAAPSSGRCPHDGGILVTPSAVVEAPDPLLGRTLAGRFTILGRIGAGSMGAVYRARQLPVGREVAIKILRSDRAVDEAARARFLREARAHSLLASPHTVTVFDFGQSDNGDFFLAMELLQGESLGQRLRRLGRLPVEMAVETARQTLRSLAEAHAKGIIHRDLKPDNLFFARAPDSGERQEEIVKVLDFGIAKLMHGEGASAPMNVVETQAGTVFGTPRYMSPEQAQAKPLDARTDLYSLGVILYHMLSGRPPFVDDDAILVMARHIKSAPRRLLEIWPEAPSWPEVDAAVMRALAKDPAGRPTTADAMAQELQVAFENDVASMSGVRTTHSNRRVSTPSFKSGPVSTISGPDASGMTTDTLDEHEMRVVFDTRRRKRIILGSFFASIVLSGTLAAWILGRPSRAEEVHSTQGLVSAGPPGGGPSLGEASGTGRSSAPALAASATPAASTAPGVREPTKDASRDRDASDTKSRSSHGPRKASAAPTPAAPKPPAKPAPGTPSTGYGLFE